MAPLFSKADSNKLWHDDQNEQNVICAQFGKDLLNISKVIGRNKVAQFFDSQCTSNSCGRRCRGNAIIDNDMQHCISGTERFQ